MNRAREFIHTFFAKTPPYVILFVTARCNARCQTCFNWEKLEKSPPQQEIQPEEVEKIAKGLSFVADLSLSGGEPFLREDLPEICMSFERQSRVKILNVPTNGLLPERIEESTRRICSSLQNVSVEIELSIDGPPAIHDHIRGIPGSFERMEETNRRLQYLKKLHPNLLLKGNVTFCSLNQDHLEDLPAVLTRRLRLDRISLSFIHGNPRNPDNLDVDPEKFLAFNRRLLKNPALSGKGLYSAAATSLKTLYAESVVRNLRKGRMNPKCTAGKKIIVIDEVCKVYPCEGLSYELGDLREEAYDIQRILNSPRTHSFLRDYIDAESCHCTWGCASINNLVYNPRTYPPWLLRTLKKWVGDVKSIVG